MKFVSLCILWGGAVNATYYFANLHEDYSLFPQPLGNCPMTYAYSICAYLGRTAWPSLDSAYYGATRNWLSTLPQDMFWNQNQDNWSTADCQNVGGIPVLTDKICSGSRYYNKDTMFQVQEFDLEKTAASCVGSYLMGYRPYERSDYLVGKSNVAQPIDCQVLCQKQSGCEYWTYYPAGPALGLENCYLSNATSTGMMSTDPKCYLASPSAQTYFESCAQHPEDIFCLARDASVLSGPPTCSLANSFIAETLIDKYYGDTCPLITSSATAAVSVAAVGLVAAIMAMAY